ncbi:MAG: dTMP kinase [Phyllobacteriaceae bacterium]|nr:dTMP kinase [Phyllobacteriaceae bacterium]
MNRYDRNLNRGLFFTFEGGEGSGKSTQIERLAAHLRADGMDVVVTREPGGSPAAEIVREVLLSGAAEKHGADVEAILFSAARRDHVETLIRPALAAGKIVLCDRFMDSTRVYQGLAGTMPDAQLKALEALAINGVVPDLTYLLDLPAEVGLARAAARRNKNDVPDRFEKETLRIHEERRRAYLAIAVKEPDRFVLIPANRAPELIADEIALVARTHLAARILQENAVKA